MHDLPGGSASLVYWVPAVAGNTTTWLIGIVNFKNQIANLVWSTQQNVAHIESFGVRPGNAMQHQRSLATVRTRNYW